MDSFFILNPGIALLKKKGLNSLLRVKTVLLHLFENVDRFGLSRFIVFAMHLYITYV